MRGNVGIFADAAELVDRAEGADLGVVLYCDMAGESRAVYENGVSRRFGSRGRYARRT